MRFYTNVQLIGNQFLVRGVENGKSYQHRDEVLPTLFVKSKTKTNMAQHLKSALEGTQFKCEMCDYNCAYKHSMTIHITSVHEGKKPFKCEICE